MQTISTKYMGATNNLGARIKAVYPHGDHPYSVTIPFDYSLNEEELHKVAVQALAKKLGWKGEMIGGHTGTGMIWVFDSGAKVTID